MATFTKFLRHAQPAMRFSRFQNTRSFSYVSKHQAFPASLYRFQLYRSSRLYDQNDPEEDRDYNDRVEVSADGLIHPKVDIGRSNGASFMPNTHFMQQVTRGQFDTYLDNVDDGQPTLDPHYLCIPKGTLIPESLILYRDVQAFFSLQPMQPMSLNILNETLSRFYLDHGRFLDAEEWLGGHHYHEAFFDDKEDWMDH
ncbi:hypothetical protein N7540_006548 [Penicillium herquei]|nr:hypothetical protein N7540_006548 [Penicillium herquei]